MNEEILYKGKHISLKKNNNWEFVSRNNIIGIVVIIPLTVENELILVEQYRPPVNNLVLELPAGLAGDTAHYHGEDLIDAAKRELYEETGYETENFTLLTEGPPSPGICSEEVTIFLATDIVKTGHGGGDEYENITIHKVPVSKAEEFIIKKRKEGLLVDPKVYMGLYFCSKILEK